MAIDQQFLDMVIAQNKAANVKWAAGPTSMLELTPAERARRMGYVPGPGEPSMEERESLARANLKHHLLTAATDIPTAIDWRSKEDRNFISSVKDQGNCGSCSAFGTAAAMEAVARIKTNIAVSDPKGDALYDLSEAQLFFCSPDRPTCQSGLSVLPALQYATSVGVAPETCFAYTDHNQPCALQTGWQNQLTKILRSSTLITVLDMKTKLANNGPLITAFSVYPDFLTYTGGVYRWNREGNPVASHCVCVVGYDDVLQAWICKNSWGTGWGLSGFFFIGYGQCGIDAQMWSVDSFAQIFTVPHVIFASDDMKKGSGANSWLIGDVNGDGKAEICQQFGSGQLGMNIYGWKDGGMSVLWSSGDMGEGAGADSWLIGDVNGDGKAEICQQFGSGQLGMNIYGWKDGGMSVLWSSGDMGEGAGADGWLIGDVNGDGKAEICQQFGSGQLGMNIYGWKDGGMSVLWSSGDMGEGAGADSWLIGDVNGDGKAEICQQFGSGQLGMNIYGWKDGGMSVLWSSGDMKEGSGANSWLIGDVNGDGKAEICQQFGSGQLGMNIYGWKDGGMSLLWSSGDVGEGAGANSWLIGDVNGDHSAEICQQFGSGQLGMNIYGWRDGGVSVLWSSGDMGEGAGANSWLIGDVNGDHSAEICQQFGSGRLGMIVYSWAPIFIPSQTS